MIIRKKFTFEGSHIVRNCSSDRCKRSLHGHGYVVEVFLTAKGFDNGMMIYDFGLMKGTIKDFIDSFDHAHSLWNMEKEEDKNFFKQYSLRWIEMPVSPSAEGYALMFTYVIDQILRNTEFCNGEQEVKVHAVRVHETTTGYAEASMQDVISYRAMAMPEHQKLTLSNIGLSDQIKVEWQDSSMWDKLIKGVKFKNPAITPNLEIKDYVNAILVGGNVNESI